MRSFFITSSATIVNGILGVLFYILVANLLGPTSFGIFTIAITVLILISDIANLGTDTGIIRFLGKYSRANQTKSLQFLKLGLEFKFLVWILILTAGWWIMPFVAIDFFTKPELIVPLRIVLIGIGGVMLFSFVSSAIQGLQKYFVWSFLNIFVNLVRLILLVTLSFLALLSINNSLWIYILVPSLGFLIGISLLPNFLSVKNEKSVAKEFFHYNKWVALFMILAAISNRVDIFLVGRFLPATGAGIYGAASQLGAIIPQLIFAIAAVAAPKLASFTNETEAKDYLKKLQLLVSIIAIIALFGIPLAKIFIPFFYGTAYLDSINIFIVLFLAQLIFLISLPVHQAVFYYFAKPQLFVWITLIHLILMIVLGRYFIGTLGLMGMAVTVLIGNISNFLIPAIWVLLKFKNL